MYYNELDFYYKKDTRTLRISENVENFERIGFRITNRGEYGGTYGTLPEGWTVSNSRQVVSYCEGLDFFDENGFRRAQLELEHRTSGRIIEHYKVYNRFDVHIYSSYACNELIVYFGEYEKPLYIAGHAKDYNHIDPIIKKAEKYANEHYPDYKDVNAYWNNEKLEYVGLDSYAKQVNIEHQKKKIEEKRKRQERKQQLQKGKEALSRALNGEENVIEHMEAEGQANAVENVLLARDMRPDRKVWEKLGFKFEDIENDNVLLKATLPEGWVLMPTSHSMWNEIYDDKNRLRAEMFYKAAFYDRSAHMSLKNRYDIHSASCGPLDMDEIIYFGNEQEVLFIAGIVKNGGNFGLPKEERDKIRHEKSRLYDLAREFAKENYPQYERINTYWNREPEKTLSLKL